MIGVRVEGKQAVDDAGLGTVISLLLGIMTGTVLAALGLVCMVKAGFVSLSVGQRMASSSLMNGKRTALVFGDDTELAPLRAPR